MEYPLGQEQRVVGGRVEVPVGAAVEHPHRVEALHQHALGFLDHAGYHRIGRRGQVAVRPSGRVARRRAGGAERELQVQHGGRLRPVRPVVEVGEPERRPQVHLARVVGQVGRQADVVGDEHDRDVGLIARELRVPHDRRQPHEPGEPAGLTVRVRRADREAGRGLVGRGARAAVERGAVLAVRGEARLVCRHQGHPQRSGARGAREAGVRLGRRCPRGQDCQDHCR